MTILCFPFSFIMAGEVHVPAVALLMMPAFKSDVTSSSNFLFSDGGCLYGIECIGTSDSVSIPNSKFLQQPS